MLLTSKDLRTKRQDRCVLRNMLKHKGMTPLTVSETLEVGETTVWSWVSGRVVPGGLVLDDLCQLLTCTVHDIYPRR